MKKLKNWKYLLSATIFLVFIINIIQGAFTELLPDEAYYWMFSQNLDWGYFDHPPGVSIWVYISNLFFSGELGVRFFSAVSYSLLFWMVWKTVDHPKKKEFTWLFLLVILSSVLLNVYGFITTPDTPLMVLYSVFLFAYQLYLKKKNLLSYVLLAVSVAGMMYSKYHGILIVLFVILSNFKLLRDPKLWLTFVFSLILLSPHLYWQFENEFPTFRYHIIERGNRIYKFDNTLLHFVNILVIFGLTFPIIYQAFFKYLKTKDQFIKSLNYIVWGFIIFFFLSTFKGHVQAQWVIAIAIPLSIIVFLFMIDHQKSRKWFVILASINILVMFIARVHLVEPFLPVKIETKGNKQWAETLKEKTQGIQKVFINSYQHAATYWFYSNERSFYLRNYTGRNNHFQLLQKDQDISANDVVLVRKVRATPLDIGINTRKRDSIFAEPMQNFKDISQIHVKILNEEIVLSNNGKNTLEIQLENTLDRSISSDEFQLQIGFMSPDKRYTYFVDADIQFAENKLNKNQPVNAKIIFDGSLLKDPELYVNIGIALLNSSQVDALRSSQHYKYKVKD